MNPIVPFEPVAAEDIPIGPKWVSQVKWDGVRVLTYLSGNEIQLYNRKLNERTHHYPELLKASSHYSASSVILDGEIIAFRDGRPSFYEVMKRDGIRNLDKVKSAVDRTQISYMIFDILYLNGEWVTSKSLEDRQSLLMDVVKPSETVHIVENYTDNAAFYEVCRANDLEGVVFKDLSKTYLIDGKDARWRKKKNHKDLIAVVGGVTFRGPMVNSLLLGLYDQEGNLWYIGNVGGGRVSQNDWKEVTKAVQAILQDHIPFKNRPAVTKGVAWIKPLITVKVQYMEWAQGHSLRQPNILAFVSVPPEECRFE
jgi:bifunctional non-homologous end joining protein LigD